MNITDPWNECMKFSIKYQLENSMTETEFSQQTIKNIRESFILNLIWILLH